MTVEQLYKDGYNPDTIVVEVDKEGMVVHLDHQGPNIMFKSTANPESIIKFIDQHWNIGLKTTGLTQDSI